MPWVLIVIWNVVLSVVPWLISKVVRAFGLGYITYVGVSVGVATAENYIFSRYDNLGTELYQILAIAGFPQGIKILFSAFAAALVLKTAATGDSIRRPIWKKPGTPWEA